MFPKLGVKLETLRPELAILEPLVDEVYAEFGLKAIVTSTNDGIHKKRVSGSFGSFHARDAAFDLRVKLLATVEQQKTLWYALRNRIDAHYPKLYDVILEYAGQPRAHIHVEPSPKLAKTMFPDYIEDTHGRV